MLNKSFRFVIIALESSGTGDTSTFLARNQIYTGSGPSSTGHFPNQILISKVLT